MAKEKEAKQKQEVKPTAGEIALQKQIEELKATALESQQALEATKQAQVEKEKLEQVEKLQSEADIKKLFAAELKEPKTDTGIDDLSPSQILDIVSDGVEKVFDAKAEQTKLSIEAASKVSNEKLDGIASVLRGVVAKISFDEVKSAHSDFDDMRPEMLEVSKKYPAMDANDMYLLAKSIKAGTAPPQKKVESERPGSHLTEAEGLVEAIAERDNSSMQPQGKARGREQKNVGRQPGIVKFREFIKAAADKVVDASRANT